MIVSVEMNSYCKAYELEHEPARTENCEDWDEMVVTPEKLVDMINKGVKIQVNQ